MDTVPDQRGGYMLPEEFISRISDSKESLIVFSVVRNERLRIHHWLEHYRRAGVRIFAVIDNGSTDGTFELLDSQPDVVVIRMTHSFSAAQFGVSWLNEIHGRIAPRTWVLFADADELLVYRGWPTRPVQALADEAASESKNAIFGFMLDMYPDGALEEPAVEDATSLFAIAPCFDADYRFRHRPLKPWERQARSIEVIGGPRVRLLSSLDRELRTTWVSYFMRGQIDRILPIVPNALVPWVVGLMPQQMPALAKVPLVMSGTGFTYSNNHGGGGGSVFFRENVILAHFKFLPDFAARVREEAARGEHYRRGAEYHMYANAMKGRRSIDLRYAGSRRFAGSEQLLEIGLIRDISPFIASGAARNSSRSARALSHAVGLQAERGSMRLTVGLATTGRRELLSETLAELAKQVRLPDRVVVCSPSPSDVDGQTAAALPFPVTVICSTPGLPAQRNAILREVGGADAIVFFDDDFFPAASYLSHAELILERNPTVVLATGKLIEDGIHGPGLSPAYARQRLADAPTADPQATLLRYYGAYGCNMVIRLAPVRKHGAKFDEVLPLYAWQEDVDFSRQLAPFGDIVQTEALTGVHLGVKRGRTSGVRFGYSQIANPIYLMGKGTMSVPFGAKRMARNLLANLAYLPWPEPHVDRLGRCKGNLLAVRDLLRGRLHPTRILEMK